MCRSVLIRNVILLLAPLLAAGCAYVTKPWITPGVNLVGVRPGQMDVDEQSFIVSLRVNNPNARTLPIKGASYSLALEGLEIANGSGVLDRQIPAHGEDVVDVEVNADLMDLLRSAPALVLSGGRWDYEISGVLQLAGGYLPVPFRYSGDVDAAQLVSRLMR
jgi:LEA14-like dessication related protein